MFSRDCGRSRWASGRCCGVLLALAWLAVLPAFAGRANEDSVRAFVEKLNQASLELSSGTDEEARKRGQELFGWAFDVPRMAEFALDQAWAKAVGAQRDTLLEAFEQDAVSAYLREMRMAGVKLEYVGRRSAEQGREFAASRRTLPDQPEETWIWELRPDNGSWRVVDLQVDGKSVAGIARKDFNAVFTDSNGDVEAVIEFMQKRAADSIEAE